MARKRKFEDLGSVDDPNNVLRPPTWEIVNLLAPYFDPKSLAIGCCVSKSWNLVMSSDSIWKPIYATDYPSLSASLRVTGDVDPPGPFRHLYAMAYTSARRQGRLPVKPTLSLKDLLFVITIVFKTSTGRPLRVDVVKRGDEIVHDPDGLFMFDIGCPDLPANFGANEDVKVTWNLVLKGWKGVFTMMDFEGQVKFSGSEAYVSDKLPSSGCCASDAGLILGDLKIRADKIIVGMLSTISWRYLSVDDGLRYLQHFLQPEHHV